MSGPVADDPVVPGRGQRTARMSVRSWCLLLVLCGALFLEGADVAMLNVAVPSIRTDLGISTGTAHWVISAYVLGYAGFVLLGGRSADIFGRRRVFLVALTVFVAFSGLGGFADSGWVLILARFVTGVAAGFTTPAGLSIVTTSFPEGPLRNRAVVIYGATGGAGFIFGMVAGGLLTTVGWRWVFFAPVIVGFLLLMAGRRVIRPDGPRPDGMGRFDVAGALAVTAGMVATVLALVQLGERGEVAGGSLAAAAAVILLILFVLLERRSASPLVRLAIFRQGMVAAASIVGMLYMASFFGFQFIGTLFLQDLLGWTPLETGLTFAVMGLDLIVAPLLTPALVRRFGNAKVMVAGFVSAVAAFALFLRLEADWGFADLVPSLILVGVAFALAYGPMTLAATAGVDEHEQGLASGMFNTATQFGAALGLAVVTILLASSSHSTAGPGDYRTAVVGPIVLTVLAILTIGVAGMRSRRLVRAGVG